MSEFQRVDLLWDNVHQRLSIPFDLKAVTGEYNGRILRIQVTDNGKVKAQNGTMTFGYLCPDGRTGVVNATLVQSDQGIYEVAYPSDMLRKVGMVACALKLADSSSRAICKTENFSVEVKDSVIHDGLEIAENSIRPFDKAILDINSHERRIALMELNFQELHKMLTSNIPNMDAKVSSRASSSQVTSVASDVSSILSTVRQGDPASKNLNAIYGRHRFVRTTTSRIPEARNTSSGFAQTPQRCFYVSGKGLLHSIAIILRSTNNAGGSFRLVIDGTTVVQLPFKNTDDSGKVITGVCAGDLNMASIVSRLPTNNKPTAPTSAILSIPSSLSSSTYLAVFDRPVYFSRSCEVLAITGPVPSSFGQYPSDCEVSYSLD